MARERQKDVAWVGKDQVFVGDETSNEFDYGRSLNQTEKESGEGQKTHNSSSK